VRRACLASALAAHLLDREAYGCDIDPGAIGSGKIGIQELLNAYTSCKSTSLNCMQIDGRCLDLGMTQQLHPMNSYSFPDEVDGIAVLEGDEEAKAATQCLNLCCDTRP